MGKDTNNDNERDIDSAREFMQKAEQSIHFDAAAQNLRVATAFALISIAESLETISARLGEISDAQQKR